MVGLRYRCLSHEEMHFVGPEDEAQVLHELPLGMVADAVVTVTAIDREQLGPNHRGFVVAFERDGRSDRMPLWAFSACFEEVG